VTNANAGMCTFCHNKTGWTDAAHRTSMQTFVAPDSSITTLGEWACRSCHVSHNGEGVPYLLTKSEENTCYSSGCHGNTGTGVNTKNIQSAMMKSYAHPTATVTGKHRNPDDEASLDVPARHAECQDCHNGHRAKKGLHTPGTNAVSESLLGVPGVLPGWTSNWTQPGTYTPIKPAVLEYQICMKCHSSNAFGTVPDGVTSIVTSSGLNGTDQAMEFSPMNKSSHPVVANSSSRLGGAPPKALDDSQLGAAWLPAGTKTMYCSDCHGNDEATSTNVPQGPHGSSQKSMLTGTGQYWPEAPGGALWTLADVRDNAKEWDTKLFCANCHPMKSGSDFLNNVHAKDDHQAADVTCITCHVAVPHGAKRSRLIGYASDVPPYNYNGVNPYDKLVVTGFQKASGPTAYIKEDCTMVGVCHGVQTGAYEP
jgi:predicted CXXCH cytochrome family protein